VVVVEEQVILAMVLVQSIKVQVVQAVVEVEDIILMPMV
jgi:hypothetical protein